MSYDISTLTISYQDYYFLIGDPIEKFILKIPSFTGAYFSTITINSMKETNPYNFLTDTTSIAPMPGSLEPLYISFTNNSVGVY